MVLLLFIVQNGLSSFFFLLYLKSNTCFNSMQIDLKILMTKEGGRLSIFHQVFVLSDSLILSCLNNGIE